MTVQLGIVMDPIESIHYKKDSTLAMLWEAQDRNWNIHYFEQKDLFLRDGQPYGDARLLKVYRNPTRWAEFTGEKTISLAELDVILMRKDPPFNEQYLYSTYLLDHAERLGVFVVNRSQSLRDANEKLFATFFPECTPPTLVTQSSALLREFWKEHKDIVCKPLNAMGGVSVFRVREDEVNANVIFETLTANGKVSIMAQRYIPEIVSGDKRILLIDGEPIPHVLNRIPQENDWRGNLAVGAKGVIEPISKRELFICNQLSPVLRQRGLYFVGIDVIGDYLTEINVTSPTGIREIDQGANTNISAILFDSIEKHLNAKKTLKDRVGKM